MTGARLLPLSRKLTVFSSCRKKVHTDFLDGIIKETNSNKNKIGRKYGERKNSARLLCLLPKIKLIACEAFVAEQNVPCEKST